MHFYLSLHEKHIFLINKLQFWNFLNITPTTLLCFIDLGRTCDSKLTLQVQEAREDVMKNPPFASVFTLYLCTQFHFIHLYCERHRGAIVICWENDEKFGGCIV